MRIAFDARGYSPSGGGTYVYLSALSEAVARLGGVMTPVFAGQEARPPERGLRLLDGIANRLSRHSAYRTDVRADKFDLFISVHHNFFPFRGVPRILHMQDLAYLHTDSYNRLKARYWRSELKKVVADYEGFIAISESTKRDLVDHFGLAENRVDVVGHGLALAFLEEPWRRPDMTGPIRFLSVGVHHPRKRLPTAVRFIHALRRAGMDARLQLVGPCTAETEAVRQTIADFDLGAFVEITGQLDSAGLLSAYRAADVLLWTSAYEGFGFPLIEAMAMSLPVVSVTNSSVPEVTGGYYVEIDTDDLTASARHVLEAVRDVDSIAELSQAAHAFVRRYTWDSAAEKVLNSWSKYANAA